MNRERQLYYLALAQIGSHKIGYLHQSKGHLCHVDISLISTDKKNQRYTLEATVCLRDSHVDLECLKQFLPQSAVFTPIIDGLKVRYNSKVITIERTRDGYLFSLQGRITDECSFASSLREYNLALKQILRAHTEPEQSLALTLTTSLPQTQQFADQCIYKKSSHGKPSTQNDFETNLVFPASPARLEDVVGCVEAKKALLRVHRDIVRPEIARYCGRDPSLQNGLMLYGPPGCGKTLLVSGLVTLLRNELGEKFKAYKIDYDKVTSIWRGGEAKRMARVFELVEMNKKAGQHTLLFIDELHAIARRHRYDEALDTLLSKIGGVSDGHDLTLIGATSMTPKELDQALLRYGRFGEHYVVELPDKTAREELFKQLLDNAREIALKESNPDILGELNLQGLSAASEGMTCADIVGCVRSAIISNEESALDQNREQDGKAGIQPLTIKYLPITTQILLSKIESMRRGGTIGFTHAGSALL